jgi:hypothetical protein
VSLRCRLGIHAKVEAAEPSIFSHDLYRCRRCPAQWRIGSHGYGSGMGAFRVRYRDRIADAAGPYDHAAAMAAEAERSARWARWRESRA